MSGLGTGLRTLLVECETCETAKPAYIALGGLVCTECGSTYYPERVVA
jgi:hypothetical protein